MPRSSAFGAIPLVLFLSAAPLQAQPPKKPPVKTAPKPKPAAKTPPAAPAKPEPPPDLSVAASYVAGNKTTTSTVLMQGARQRVSYEPTQASIQQCDKRQSLQLNLETRVYLVMPYADASAAAPPSVSTGKKKGGSITYTTTVTDTGEKKPMFGYTARHLKTSVVKEASPDACDKKPERVEIDGWYIDLPAAIACVGAPPPEKEIRVDPKDASCSDAVTYVRPSGASAYPIGYTMVTSSGTDAPVTTTMEATDVKAVKLDPALFEVPADFVAVKTPTQLTADHRPGEDGPKKPGTIRIGVAPLANTSGQPATTKDLGEALIESFEEANTDAVLLHSTTQADLAAEAKARSVDFILTNTISEMKRPGKSMLGKISGTSAEGLAAKVDYALVAPGMPKPAISGSEKSGTSMLQIAVSAAKRVSQFVTPLGYMKTFAAMSGNATPGMMRQTQDPVLSSVFALVDRATGAKPQPMLTSEDAAAAAALQKEIESIIAELKKKKT